MGNKKKITIVVFIGALIIFLLMINVFFVVDVYTKRDYVYCSTGVGSSMYPYIKNGDTLVILTKNSPDFSLAAGDVLVYVYEDSAVAHRIYKISNSRYFLKGDNNEFADESFVTDDQVIGKVYGVIDQNNVLQKFFVEQFINN